MLHPKGVHLPVGVCCQRLTAPLLQASSGVKQWNKRWFVLVDRCLFYYKGTMFVGSPVFAGACFCGCLLLWVHAFVGAHFCGCTLLWVHAFVGVSASAGACFLWPCAFVGACFLQVFLLFAGACFLRVLTFMGACSCGCSPCWGTEGLMLFARLLAAHSAQLSLAAEGEHELLSRLAY